MASRRRDVVLFSTSAIDLLACGLAAVLVLWVLTLSASDSTDAGERQTGYGEIRLRQYGVWHFAALRLQSADFSLDHADPNSSAEPASAVVAGSDPHANLMALKNVGGWNRSLLSRKTSGPTGSGRLSIETRGPSGATQGKDDPFAGEITIKFAGLTSAATLDVSLQICQAEQTHYIEIRRIDFRRPKITRYVIQCKGSARDMFRNPLGVGAQEWQVAFFDALRSDPALWQPSPVEYLVYDDCDTPQSLQIAYKADGTVDVRLTPRAGAFRAIDGKRTLDLLAQWTSAAPATTGRP